MKAELPATEWAIGDTTPHDWRLVADFLRGILGREPARSSDGYAVQRMILGAFAAELGLMATEAGEPPSETIEEVSLYIEGQPWPHQWLRTPESVRLRQR